MSSAAAPLYEDRVEAGAILANSLAAYAGPETLVLGIPRGGVVVAAEIARRLDAELDVVVVKKIGAPGRPELAIGAVASSGTTYLNEPLIAEIGVSKTYLRSETQAQREAALDRASRLRGVKAQAKIAHRPVIIVDDGIATGATIRAAARVVKGSSPSKVIVAVPVGAEESCARIALEVDEVVCPATPRSFFAIGQHYRDFGEVSEDEVKRIVEHAPLPAAV